MQLHGKEVKPVESERIAKLEARMDDYHEAIQRLEKRLDAHEQQINNLKDSEGKLPPWAAALFTLLATLVGTIISTFLRFLFH
jgi:septal ring factor EnvC (AmiA/AmiB activator)